MGTDPRKGTLFRRADKAREAEMTDRELSDQAIAVLVDIARAAGRDLNAGQRLELDRLVSEGLVAVSDSGDPAGQRHYRLTVAGQRALDQRGVGANEA
ncbi:hypothetical protein DNX69_05235 [Rhodopseudomonas palustris]|uniref:Uncharacterized protein n=1 Tax=Rhodopseudomonas palustris TaxID=1076 RepID=A0A323UKW2_RHOPL|nr:hypothetical protein DNX69_05235 [Rhodopseudomonas palustris]